MVFYLLFLVFSTLLGAVYIGPFSVRVYTTIMMLSYLIFTGLRRKSFKMYHEQSFITQYIAFILLMGIAMIFNGDFEPFNYPKYILAYHLVAITSFYATLHFVKTKEELNTALITIALIVAATSIVSIMQFRGDPIGWTISGFFGEMTEHTEESLEIFSDSLLGSSLACGIMQRSFLNAMYISSCAFLMFPLIMGRKPLLKKVIWGLLLCCSIYACFAVQQRGAFYIMIAAMIFVSLVKFKFRTKIVAIVAIVAILISGALSNNVLSEEAMGRLAVNNLSADEDIRGSIWANAETYILDNLMWGGVTTFKSLNHGYAAHNFIYNAFIYAGLLGGLVIILLFIRIVIRTVRPVLHPRRSSNELFFVSLALLCYMAQGMVHNASLITGDLHVWTLFALTICAQRISTKEKRTNY